MTVHCHRSGPIGVFDSGVGGLTVYQELKQLLPAEWFVYLGDTARVPYGTKSKEVVLKYALQNSLFLLDQGVKMIVVACNTASAYALRYLQDRLKVPVVGVIESGVKAALAHTKNLKVGVIGTEGTIKSGAYERLLKQANPTITVFSRATGLFVPLI
ncbi:MAG: glutamate racemase [Deltaproteobacteria bacterium]|nr:glutamate racemase [Deltaproteobacteria bacterium]